MNRPKSSIGNHDLWSLKVGNVRECAKKCTFFTFTCSQLGFILPKVNSLACSIFKNKKHYYWHLHKANSNFPPRLGDSQFTSKVTKNLKFDFNACIWRLNKQAAAQIEGIRSHNIKDHIRKKPSQDNWSQQSSRRFQRLAAFVHHCVCSITFQYFSLLFFFRQEEGI